MKPAFSLKDDGVARDKDISSVLQWRPALKKKHSSFYHQRAAELNISQSILIAILLSFLPSSLCATYYNLGLKYCLLYVGIDLSLVCILSDSVHFPSE